MQTVEPGGTCLRRGLASLVFPETLTATTVLVTGLTSMLYLTVWWWSRVLIATSASSRVSHPSPRGVNAVL